MTKSTCANVNDITVTQLMDNTEFICEGKRGIHANDRELASKNGGEIFCISRKLGINLFPTKQNIIQRI